MGSTKTSVSYLSDLRPDFRPFEIDCGKIPGYRFKGNLRTELEAGRIEAKTAIDLLEDMLMIREMEEMIVKLRSGAYEPHHRFQLPRARRTFRSARKALPSARAAP